MYDGLLSEMFMSKSIFISDSYAIPSRNIYQSSTYSSAGSKHARLIESKAPFRKASIESSNVSSGFLSLFSVSPYSSSRRMVIVSPENSEDLGKRHCHIVSRRLSEHMFPDIDLQKSQVPGSPCARLPCMSPITSRLTKMSTFTNAAPPFSQTSIISQDLVGRKEVRFQGHSQHLWRL